MTISPALLVQQIIRPTLLTLAGHMERPWIASPESVAMMLATAWMESECGCWLAQQPNDGPAFGIWQLECRASFTAQDVLERRVLGSRPLVGLWHTWTGTWPVDMAHRGSHGELSRILMANHHACCMLARLRYLDYAPEMPRLMPPSEITVWIGDAARAWSCGYWRGADTITGIERFMDKLSRAPDVLAEVERIREEAV